MGLNGNDHVHISCLCAVLDPLGRGIRDTLNKQTRKQKQATE